MAEVKVYSIIGKKRNAYDQNDYLSGQQFCDALTAAEASADASITISINSPGGSVTDGYAMISAMKKCTKPVVAVIDGFAASMGYLICLGATEIKAAQNSMIMVHSVQGSAAGSPEDLIAEAEVLKKFNATVATLLAARTGLTEEEVTEKYLGKEVWLTAAEALEAKLIDAIESYSAELVPDVNATMSYEDATARFAAMHQTSNEKTLLEKFTAHIKGLFGLTEKPTRKAMLSETEESSMCCVLWDVRMAADDADYALKNASSPEAKAILEEVVKTCSALTVKITNAVYGEEVTEPAEVEALVKQYVAKAAATKAAVTNETAITAAKEFVAAELKQVSDALAAANAEVTALKEENAQLKETPAANIEPVKTAKGNKNKPIEVDRKYETSYDREARLRREQKQ